MKKLILPFACVALLASCKKDYTCECDVVTTSTSGSNSTTSSYSSSTVYKDVKKKFVADKAECYSTETSYIQNFGGGDVTVKRTSDCTISK
jgi:hypothetical protein